MYSEGAIGTLHKRELEREPFINYKLKEIIKLSKHFC